MREIKFRVFDKKNNKWLNDNDIKLKLDWNYDTFWIYHKQISIMQLTWLKDKNWKEIFEGDIVNIAKDNWISNKKLEVKWDKWGFFPLTLYALECEIIGNIYENPNLLENE